MAEGRREVAREVQPRREAGRKERRSGGGFLGFLRGIWMTIWTLFLVAVCTTLMLAGIFMTYVNTTLKPSLQINADDYTMNLSSFIYYQDKETGQWVEEQNIHGTENRILVDYNQMPDALWQAAVAIEDQRFFQHHGVDWKRTAGATLNMFIGMRDTYGGSTITQQLLKNMTQANEGTVNRKVREIFRALEFEKNYEKEDILEMYLNSIYLGKDCYGVQTAAQYYFGKDVSELDVAECASLIAITNNPSMYGPMYDIEITVKRKNGTTEVKTPRELNKERQETILDKMADEETGLCYLTKAEAAAAKAEELHFVERNATASQMLAEDVESGNEEAASRINSWFVDQVIREVAEDLGKVLGLSRKEAQVRLYNGGYRIYTTMDPEIQAIAESVYEDRSNLDVTSSDGQKIKSAITIIEPSTGNIVAQVGDIGKKTTNLPWNYAVDKRQPGSSIKPLTAYAPALDAGAVTMATVLDNYPVRLLNGKPWPKNSPQGYSGLTPLATGVARSINTIAVRTLEKVGVTSAYAFATENLGLDLAPEDMAESPLGMGGLTYGLTTVEMAAAYAAFANSGIYNSPRYYLRVEDSNGNVVLENYSEQHVAMKETTAYFMNTMLKGAVDHGTGTSANFGGMTIAGKTGTTNNNYTRYFVGYTPYYVAAVWTGYRTNARISYSGNPAITMWKKVMREIHKDLPNKDFPEPTTGLTSVTVCRDSGLKMTSACSADSRGGRGMTVSVATGTAPTEYCNLHTTRRYCTEGNCVASEFCPEESVVTRGYLSYHRENIGGVWADDSAYMTGYLPSSGECPVHTAEGVVNPLDPENPDVPPGTDPNDPNSTGEPANPNNPEDPNGTTWITPEDPNVPNNPPIQDDPPNENPDPSGGSQTDPPSTSGEPGSDDTIWSVQQP